VRLLGLGVGGLTPVQQLQLFSDDELTRSAINTQP
jgi:hypothetical protein